MLHSCQHGRGARCVQGTVLYSDNVTKGITEARRHRMGISQKSIVLHDKCFTPMKKSEWDTAVDPKI